jgi:hypothetical protein
MRENLTCLTWPDSPRCSPPEQPNTTAQVAAHTAHLTLRQDKTEDNVFVFVSNSGRARARHRAGNRHVLRSSPPLLTASARKRGIKRTAATNFPLFVQIVQISETLAEPAVRRRRRLGPPQAQR